MLAREFVRHPYWPLHAAQVLGHDMKWPVEYERAKLNRNFVSPDGLAIGKEF